MEETSVRQSGNFAHPYSVAIRDSLQAALALESGLEDWILHLEGMSGRLYRHLINNLVRRIRSARYLEVGSWAGSTASAAIFGNTVKATCIDNWSEFGGPRELFWETVTKARSPAVDLRVLENDFRQVDYGSLGRFNIYLYDGPHAYEDQIDGICMAQPALDGTYIQIVDDWNWPYVRNGTRAAIAQANLDEIYALEIRTTQDDSHPAGAIRQNSAWHNGCYISVCKKRSQLSNAVRSFFRK